jgi:putative addiction module component (TIGR02574 family)
MVTNRGCEMHGAQEIIEEASALPVEERAMVVDQLLRSLNATATDIDQEWLAEARKRRAEMKSGAVQAVPGDAVLARLRDRLVR